MAAALTVRFEDEELLRRFKVRCAERDTTMAEVIRGLVTEWCAAPSAKELGERLDAGRAARPEAERTMVGVPEAPESRSTGPGPEPPPGRPSSAQGRVLGGKPGCDHKDKKVVAGIRICADDACKAVIRR